jgi:hypothetical protein
MQPVFRLIDDDRLWSVEYVCRDLFSTMGR